MSLTRSQRTAGILTDFVKEPNAKSGNHYEREARPSSMGNRGAIGKLDNLQTNLIRDQVDTGIWQ